MACSTISKNLRIIWRPHLKTLPSAPNSLSPWNITHLSLKIRIIWKSKTNSNLSCTSIIFCAWFQSSPTTLCIFNCLSSYLECVLLLVKYYLAFVTGKVCPFPLPQISLLEFMFMNSLGLFTIGISHHVCKGHLTFVHIVEDH